VSGFADTLIASRDEDRSQWRLTGTFSISRTGRDAVLLHGAEFAVDHRVDDSLEGNKTDMIASRVIGMAPAGRPGSAAWVTETAQWRRPWASPSSSLTLCPRAFDCDLTGGANSTQRV